MKRLLTIILAITLVFTMTACGEKTDTTTATTPDTTTVATTTTETTQADADSHYPVTIETYNFAHEKVEVTFDKAPEKVFVEGANNIEIMMALGLADKIVLLTGPEADKILPDLQEEYKKCERIDKMPSKEDLLALEPDFILAWYGAFSKKAFGDVDFWHEREIRTYMSLNSFAMGKNVPMGLKYEYKDIMNIGKIFNVEEKAAQLVKDINKQVEEVGEKTKDLPAPKVAIIEEYNPGEFTVYGEQMLAGSLAVTLGAELAMGADIMYTTAGEENVIEANPEVIFVVYYGELTPEEAADKIYKNEAFTSLDAVKNKRVYGLALSGIYTSGLRTKNGLIQLSKGMYPELFE